MGELNKILKIMFIVTALSLLMVLVGAPKTHCQACSLEYDGETYDGYEAFELYEDACISYDKPWDELNLTEANFTFAPSYMNTTTTFYVDIDDINISYDENGTQIISFPEEYLE